jgi:hypothetical protein
MTNQELRDERWELRERIREVEEALSLETVQGDELIKAQVQYLEWKQRELELNLILGTEPPGLGD